MSGPAERDDFFIGYLGRLPAALRAPIGLAAVGLLLGFAGGGLALSAFQDDPGPAGFAGGATIQGVMRAAPYPHLRLDPTPAHPEGRTRLLVRPGKRGVQDLAERFEGRRVEARGVWIRRGEIEMLQLGSALTPLEDAAAAPAPPEDLGRWRISGEICDGKCVFGAMRPGRGLAHKACANLCLIGGAPPVLVATAPVAAGGLETEFLLLADPKGRALDLDALRDRTALLLSMEGALERRGDLLVFKTDLAEATEP